MAPLVLVDSHVHLWPESAANQDGHSWMVPGMILAKQHVLTDYYAASQQVEGSASNVQVQGLVYIETDRRYDSTSDAPMAIWAKGPLEEVKFLRSVVTNGGRDSRILAGIVLWAPMDRSTDTLAEWLTLAEQAAGPETWQKVKGFRFLLQAIHDQSRFTDLVTSQHFVDNLKILGKRGFSFDIGVDQHSGGVWQLEGVAKAMEMAHAEVGSDEKVVFILNHLCKPDFSADRPDYDRWKLSIQAFSKLDRTYMKLSGAFSEVPSGLETSEKIASQIRDWVTHVLAHFGPGRVMFGSDWPVCNLGGPGSDESWVAWKDVVTSLLDDPILSLSDADKNQVCHATAENAYKLNL